MLRSNGHVDSDSVNQGDSASYGHGGRADSKERLRMHRRVDLMSGVGLIAGTMIGSGIFVSPAGLLARTGSLGYSLLVWLLCGVLSMMGALAYAELGTTITSSGAEYAYFMTAFGPFPAYLFSWVSTMIIKPSQLAIICLSFAEYVVEAFAVSCRPPDAIIKLVGITTVALVTFINCTSVKLATLVQNVFLFCKLLAIAIIVGGGVYTFFNEAGFDRWAYRAQMESATPSLGSLAMAFYSGLWAYDGWNNLNYVTEEIINPSKNLPRSILIAIPLVTLCYLLVNVAYLEVMSKDEMMISDAVAITFGLRILGPLSWIMPLAVAISTFGSANGTIFAAGRLCYVASREGHLVDVLSFVHKTNLTPVPALVFHALIAELMILSGNIESLIDFFSFTVWIFYGMSMLAVLYLRKTHPDLHRPYRVPLFIPVLVLLASVFLVVAPIVDSPKIEYVYAMIFIVVGALLYVPCVMLKMRPSGMGTLTQKVQLLLKLLPAASMPEC